MKRLDRLADTLDVAGVVGKRTVNLGETRGRENDIGMIGRFGQEQLLNRDEILAREAVRRLEAAADQECL